ncbi:transposase [Thomasclavelia cocleata]|uniref:transposase n=1 Tax=Thomasclavelia cocleata TaxID=69824 RepID=UPI00242C8F31|nr:transposase [Thomasclavelia cocleata]
MDARFKHIKSVGKVIRQRKVIKYDDQKTTGNEIVVEVIYVTNLENIKIKEFSRYIRKHWTIENSLHWIFDNVFKEDRCIFKKSLESLLLITYSG